MSHLKKILHVRHSLGEGGITTFVDALVDLNKTTSVQHQVLVWKDTPKNNDIPLLIDMSSSTNRTDDFARIVKDFDTVFVHSIMPFMLKSLLRKKPHVYLFQHGITFGSGMTKIAKRFYYFFIINVLRFKVVCSSQFAKQKLLRMVPVFDKSLLLIIGFGIDMQVSSQKQTTNQDVLNIGFAGRLVGQKRVSRIIKALSHLKDETAIEFHIAGDGPLLEQLQLETKAFDASKIKFKFYGFVQDMEDFYSKLDVFILPSVGESFGLAVLEAIARDIPAIVFNDTGACVEFIQEGKNGFVVENSIELSKKLRELRQMSRREELQKNMNNMDLSIYDITSTRAKLDAL